ncbi:hypothetical protein KQI84_08665 [bacterium]|nr:hypothetical protein [bacterium]
MNTTMPMRRSNGRNHDFQNTQPQKNATDFPPPNDEANDSDFIRHAAERLATDDHITWIAGELIQAEVEALGLLIDANLSRLNEMINNQKPISEETPLLEILVAIQVNLAGRDRDEARRWIMARRSYDCYRRDAIWEALAWITAAAEHDQRGQAICQATSRAFLHDELVRNMYQPAEKTIDALEKILREDGNFYELALARREQYLTRQQPRDNDRKRQSGQNSRQWSNGARNNRQRTPSR